MSECYKCGISGEKTKLFDAISKEGIVKICSNCSLNDDIPIIKKPTDFQLKAAQSPTSVYSRLSRMAGLNPEEHKDKFLEKRKQRTETSGTSLREIVDRTYEKKFQKKGIADPSLDLINNFHWVVMRARRMKKITQQQLAVEIGEPENSIKMIEQGNLPEGSSRLIDRLESFLNIKLRKSKSVAEKKIPSEVKFDPVTANSLTIADLREIKARQNTNAMSKEIEEDIALNQGFELDEVEGGSEPKKKESGGFLRNLFFGKKKEEPGEEEIGEEEEKKDVD